ncbi:hypothetical protein DQ04_03181060 [Trypanosoma grayi]|uniref:hypothetical protein n=1 Tax=Trypanosoma grayi TaxID=71804 RepID=UPI0004F45B51|nr:hypothetical protein DQ04_03181060 [Trypanosoma grayi]KEG10893.1 hypothetical protein DQ04_03181060 [Trypanosoma grayi]
MAALLQQLQHVLAAWDAGEDVERLGATLNTSNWIQDRRSSKHKSLFMASVDAASVGDVMVQAGGECPPWLEEEGGPARADAGAGDAAQRGARVDTLISPGTTADASAVHRRVTKLELARAALALFTSNAGVYRPILRTTLGFVFEFIDELLDENMDLSSREADPQRHVQVWSAAENEEVATAHERMRMTEVRMAKLVEESATQRDHLKAEIATHQAREARLERLLQHQIELSHAAALPAEAAEAAAGNQHDPLYVKRLIARAEKELAVDELQQEVESLLKEREDLNRHTQSLMELNGRYAQQCVELAARMSILTDHNIGIAIESQHHRNEVLVEQHRGEKHRRDLQVARNVVMAAFVNRHHSVQRWWGSIREQPLERAAETFLRLANRADEAISTTRDASDSGADADRKETVQTEEHDEANDNSATAGVVAPSSIARVIPESTALHHLWLPAAGNNPETPMHLRTTSHVEYLRVNPHVAERMVHMLLTEWGSETPRRPLDVYTCEYLQLSADKREDNPSSSPIGEKELAIPCRQRIQIAYALDAVSRSGCCGSLTYAFGLVSRRQVHEHIFHMMRLDTMILQSICHFLDTERSPLGEPRGIIPVVQFACILNAMYPSYSVLRLQQLLDAAKNDGGSQAESPVLLHYSVLLPERMIPGTVSVTVENAGALWDTCFAHLLNKFVCEDVEESWQTVENSFYTFAASCNIASEQQLLYQAFKEMPEEDNHAWAPALGMALSSWDDLKAEKASILVEEVPRVPVKEAVKYLRHHTIIRRGTRPGASEDHLAFLDELQRHWNNFAGGHSQHNLDRCIRLVECLEQRRHAVWGDASMPAGEMFRHVDADESPTTNALLARLLEQQQAET